MAGVATDQDQTVVNNKNNDTDTAGKETANITRDEEQDANDQQMTDEASATETKNTGVKEPKGVVDLTEEDRKKEYEDDAEVTKRRQKEKKL